MSKRKIKTIKDLPAAERIDIEMMIKQNFYSEQARDLSIIYGVSIRDILEFSKDFDTTKARLEC